MLVTNPPSANSGPSSAVAGDHKQSLAPRRESCLGHTAGQWERIERATKTPPYLLYQLGPSREHRPEHVGWARILLRADHPWWEVLGELDGIEGLD